MWLLLSLREGSHIEDHFPSTKFQRPQSWGMSAASEGTSLVMAVPLLHQYTRCDV